MDNSQVTPHFCCDFCGETYGRKDCSDFATWHVGFCDVCGDEEVAVTAVREYGGLYDTWRDGRDDE